MKELFKKFHVIVLSFVLAISNVIFINQANAASIGGWSLSNPVAKGASTLYQGAKNAIINGKNVAKTSTALITPAAADVAKLLRGGAAGYALSIAVEQLLGAVDWVLDPENNQIVYYPEVDPKLPELPMVWVWGKIIGSSASSLCDRILSYDQSQPSSKSVKNSIKMNSSTSATCYLYDKYDHLTNLYTIGYKVNPNYNPEAEEAEEKYLPLDVVAKKVISNAEGGDSAAQEATTAAAANIVSEAEKDSAKARPIVNQLEANSQTATNETATGEAVPKDPTAPDAAKPTDISLEFPVFCSWAPIVCEAAQVVIAFPANVEVWATDLIGTGEKVESNTKNAAESTQAIEEALTKEDGIPQKDKTDINLPDLPITPQTVNVNWGGSCPAPTTTTISFGGQSQQITIMRYDFICEWAWVIKFSVIALASIGAVFIISGRKT